MNEKNIKTTKIEHAFKNFESTFNIGLLYSFNPALQLKATESAIKSKLIELSTKLKHFKFVTILVLVFKNQSMSIFIQAQKQK